MAIVRATDVNWRPSKLEVVSEDTAKRGHPRSVGIGNLQSSTHAGEAGRANNVADNERTHAMTALAIAPTIFVFSSPSSTALLAHNPSAESDSHPSDVSTY